jgi:hypothetical protein
MGYLLVIGAVLFVVGFWLLSTRMTFDYEVNACCTSMPSDDEKLEQWLGRQPGVGNRAVGRVGARVIVNFVMTQSLWRTNPSAPDLVSAMRAYGYNVQRDLEWKVNMYHFRE